MYYSLLPVAFFLPISTAVVETGASFCITAFFVKQFILISLRGPKHAELRKSFTPVNHFLVLPVRLYFYAIFFSVVFSQFPYLSWKGFIGKTVEGVVLFFAVAACLNNRHRLNCFLTALTGSAIVVALDGIWQYFFRVNVIFQKPITVEGRITGPFSHPNDYGSFLLVVTTFFVGVMVWSWANRRDKSPKPDFFLNGKIRFALLFIGAVLTATALGWTFSRGAWIGFGCAMLLLAFCHGKKLFLPVIFLAVFWVVFSAQLGSVRNVSFITDDIAMDERYKVERMDLEKKSQVQKSELKLYQEDISSALSRFNWTGRQVFWSETIEVFKTAPFFGTGLNTYTEAVQRYNPQWSGYYSHNCYLQMLAETGIVGLASFLWIMFILTKESWKTFSKMPNGFYRVILMALFCSLAGFWVHCAMDTSFYSARLGNLMWVMMGAVTAVIQLEGKS